MYILILSFASLRINSCREITPNYGVSFSPWILHGCMQAVRHLAAKKKRRSLGRSPGKRLSSNRQNLISKCTLVYPQSNKKYFNFINLLTYPSKFNVPEGPFHVILWGGNGVRTIVNDGFSSKWVNGKF